jgi:hypothetical protein
MTQPWGGEMAHFRCSMSLLMVSYTKKVVSYDVKPFDKQQKNSLNNMLLANNTSPQRPKML